MKKVYQTLWPPKDKWGNCAQAITASYFGCNLGDIPDFEKLNKEDNSVNGTLYYMKDYFFNRNYDLLGGSSDPFYESNYAGYYFAYGKHSRRKMVKNDYHIVIYRYGKLYHDPHPEGRGIESVHGFLIVSKIRRDTTAPMYDIPDNPSTYNSASEQKPITVEVLMKVISQLTHHSGADKFFQ